MRRPTVVDGWLMVPYSGPDNADVQIAISARQLGPGTPAFLDWHEDQRVAKIRPPAGVDARGVTVWLIVDGYAQRVGPVESATATTR